MPARVGDYFQNPEKKSLKDLYLKIDVNGFPSTISALDRYWATRDLFANYESLVQSDGHVKQNHALDEWRFDAECFREDMEYLLKLRFHEFWSYIVFQKPVLNSVISFLQNATPFYINMAEDNPPSEVLDLYDIILELVVRIIFRTVVVKESPEEWMTNEFLAELLYENYIITVPMLFDLLIAVGNAGKINKYLLEKIFMRVLEISSEYMGDLYNGLEFFLSAFNNMNTQTENEGCEGAVGGTIDESMDTPYDDVVMYAVDCAYSLSLILEICPPVRELCGDFKLGQNIAHFYDTTIPSLYKNISLINPSASSLKWLNQARIQFLQAFQYIAHSHVEAVQKNPSDSSTHCEKYIALLTECLSEQTFVVDFQSAHPVEVGMLILKENCKDFDSFKADFVMSGYRKECEMESAGTFRNIELISNKNQQVKNNIKHIEINTNQLVKPDKKEATSQTYVRDIDTKVIELLEVFPDFGTGFLRKVMERYDSTEEAITAILEDNLPPDIMIVDRSGVYIPPDPLDKVIEDTGVHHYNRFDGDQYDIMLHDNPNCIIKQGKGFPNVPQDAGELLDDKSDLKQIRHRYEEYNLIAEDDDEENNIYNDEYDDSYDAMLESESRFSKSKKSGILGENDDNSEEQTEESSNGEEDNDEPQANRDRTSMNFCENPEIVRARYEAARQAKWQNRKSADSGRQNAVVGNAKGQGQDKETINHRNHKEINKSSRANHNRKKAAAYKHRNM